MAITAELFEKNHIDRDSIILDSGCFNYIFNEKKWFIEYEEIEAIATGSSSGVPGTAIGRGVVSIPIV
jgi:hypothetical protein